MQPRGHGNGSKIYRSPYQLPVSDMGIKPLKWRHQGRSISRPLSPEERLNIPCDSRFLQRAKFSPNFAESGSLKKAQPLPGVANARQVSIAVGVNDVVNGLVHNYFLFDLMNAPQPQWFFCTYI